MAEFFQWISGSSTPAIVFIYLCVIAFIIVVIIFLVALVQGRDISLWPLKISGEPKSMKPKDQQQYQSKKPERKKKASSSQERLSEIQNQVTVKANEFKTQNHNEPPDLFYRPRKLPSGISYMYAARYEITEKLRSIVLARIGAWPGCSYAWFDTLFDLVP